MANLNAIHGEGTQMERQRSVSPLREEETAETLPRWESSVLLKHDDILSPKETRKHSIGLLPTARAKLGGYLFSVLLTTTAVVLAAVGFLSMLYWSDSSNLTWHRIVIQNRLTQAVSLTSLALRTAISLQAAIGTSMLAAIMLEQGIKFADAAEISIARLASSGPHSVLLPFMRQRAFAPTTLLVILALTTFGTQFSSTILLSDLSAAAVPAFAGSNVTAIGLAYPPNTTRVTWRPEDFMASLSARWKPNYWAQGPVSFPTFAEYSVPPPSPPTSGVDDTGLTVRSFMPLLLQSDREALQNYTGETATFDNRVVCVRPEFQGLRAVNYTLVGTVKPSQPSENLIFNETGIPFQCLPSPVIRGPKNMVVPNRILSDNHRDTTWTLCRLDKSAGGLISMLDPTNNQSLRHYWSEGEEDWSENDQRRTWMAATSNEKWPIDLGNAYLILNYSSGDPFPTGPGYNESWISFRGDGVWLDAYVLQDQDFNFTIRSTICFDALTLDSSHNHIQEFNISATSQLSRKEPTLNWEADPISFTKSNFDTAEVRRQLGATQNKTTVLDRGILMSNPEPILAEVKRLSHSWKADWGPAEDDYDTSHNYNWFNQSTYSWAISKVLSDEGLNAPFCYLCSPDIGLSDASKLPGITQTPVNIVQSALFNDIINDTGSPASALQAHLTMLLRMAYYDYFPQFDQRTNVSTLFTQSSLVPTSRRGFFAVVILIALHFLIITAISITFFAKTRFSRLNNAWEVITQVANSPRAGEVMAVRDGSRLGSSFKRALNGQDRVRYRLGYIHEEEEIALILIEESD